MITTENLNKLNNLPHASVLIDFFNNDENGTPDNISRSGCMALANIGFTNNAIWNEWRKAFPTRINFGAKSVVLNRADFSNQNFQGMSLNFSGFNFGDYADFSNSKWGYVNFEKCIFGESANFESTEWYGDKERAILFFNFTHSQWGEGANFQSSKWIGDGPSAWFHSSKWHGGANFSKSEFGFIDFRDAVFMGDVCFSEIICNYDFWMHSQTDESNAIHGMIDFSNATFKKSVIFNNRIFKDATKFSGAIFINKVPTFHAAKLHQNTSFDNAQFPIPFGNNDNERAYRTLKLAFSKFQSSREESFFFRKEMAEESKSANVINKPWYLLYKLTSNFGESIFRPMAWFLIIWIAYAWCYGFHDENISPCINSGCSIQWGWLNYSFLQALPFSLESIKTFNDSIKNVNPIIIATQKILSSIFLFLIGLGLRNLFKLK